MTQTILEIFMSIQHIKHNHHTKNQNYQRSFDMEKNCTSKASNCVTHIVTPYKHMPKTEKESAKNAKPKLKHPTTC